MREGLLGQDDWVHLGVVEVLVAFAVCPGVDVGVAASLHTVHPRDRTQTVVQHRVRVDLGQGTVGVEIF